MRKTGLLNLDFGSGRENRRRDFVLRLYNPGSQKCKIKVLIFADSRGTYIKQIDASWALRLFDYLKKRGVSALLVVRPRDCTVFLTLLNFLELNKLHFNYLVSQIGLVDFTPKKAEIINDILAQKRPLFNHLRFKTERLQRYKLSNGKSEYLYSIRFDTKRFKMEIVNQIERNFKKAFFLGALEVNPMARLKRTRPAEFYRRLEETNRFLVDLQRIGKRIKCIQPLSPRLYKANLSYDGVHYTALGHRIIESALKDTLLVSLRNP